MGRTGTLERYLAAVPLPVAAALLIAILLAVVFIPRQYRLGASLLFLMVWLTVGSLPDLALHSLAKVTSVGTYVVVGLAAYLHPGPRRTLAPIIYLYPIMAVVGFFYILTVIDLGLALAMQLNWLALTIAALLVVRTVTDNRMLLYVLGWMVAGMCIAICLPFAAFMLEGRGAFRAGLNRFYPYGANPNQIGVLFAMTAILTAYFGYRLRVGLLRIILFGFAGIGVGLALLTASRSIVAVTFFPLLPLVFAWSRRPVLAVFLLIVVLVPITWILGKAGDVNLERLQSLRTARTELTGVYLAEVVAERPFWGLMGTTDQSYFADMSLQYTHNAYLKMLYVGGVSYTLPMMIVVSVAIFSLLYCWWHRARLSNDPLLIQMLAATLFITYAHGFVNEVGFHPTFAWAFMHVFLAALFTAAARDLKMMARAGLSPHSQPAGAPMPSPAVA